MSDRFEKNPSYKPLSIIIFKATRTAWSCLLNFLIGFTSTMIHHVFQKKTDVPLSSTHSKQSKLCGCSVERWVILLKDNANNLTGFGFDNINIFPWPWVFAALFRPPKKSKHLRNSSPRNTGMARLLDVRMPRHTNLKTKMGNKVTTSTKAIKEKRKSNLLREM